MAINTGELSQAYLKPEGADRVERERRERLERDVGSLRQQAPELGETLLQVFDTLPGALAEASAAELKRLRERYGSEHPRVRRALREHEHMQGIAVRFGAGSARARKLLDFAHLEGQFFHGVVADTDSRPLAEVELRIQTPRGLEPLQGRTDADGYFRIALPRRQDDGGESEPPQARVQILDADGRVAHADPLPLALDGATHYREYRIEPPRGCGDPRPTPAPNGSGNRPRPTLETSTPLEHVRGIGPKRAETLRRAGIADLESLLAADADRLIELLGFDIGPTREEAEKVLAEHRREQASAQTAATSKPSGKTRNEAKSSTGAKSATKHRPGAAAKKPRRKG